MPNKQPILERLLINNRKLKLFKKRRYKTITRPTSNIPYPKIKNIVITKNVEVLEYFTDISIETLKSGTGHVSIIIVTESRVAEGEYFLNGKFYGKRHKSHQNVLKLKWTVQRQYALQIAKIWQDMTRKLNNCGGPVRDATHWKKVFTEWKSHTRRKLKFNKPLNELEEKLVKLIGLTSKPERKQQIKLQSYTESFTNITKQNRSSFAENMAILSKIKEETDNCEPRDKSRCSEKEMMDSSGTLPENRALSELNESRNKQKNCASTNVITTENPRNGLLNTEALSMHRSSDISTQVDDELMEISRISDRVSIGRGLQSLADALNRYCEIVEKRFT